MQLLALCGLLVGAGAGAQVVAVDSSTEARDFGRVAVGHVVESHDVTFEFAAAQVLSSSRPYTIFTQGATGGGLEFTEAASGETCRAGRRFAAGEHCTVSVNFAPKYAGLREGAVTLFDSAGAPVAKAYLTGMGVGPQTVFTPGVIRSLYNDPAMEPAGIAIDGAGSVYVADLRSHVIRKISAAGVATIYAGTGVAGGGGDGGAATEAMLDQPVSLSLDPAGNLYVIDRGSASVRVVDSAGTISTVFASHGGSPEGIATDSRGNLYVADSGSRQVFVLGRGRGAAKLLAGTGEAGYSGDGGPAAKATLTAPHSIAVDGDGTVYIADALVCAVRKVTADGDIGTVTGTGGCALGAPQSLVVDGGGNLFVGHGSQVVEVSAAGVVTAVAGTGVAGFSGDGGAATGAQLSGVAGFSIDGEGNLYIADSGNGRVRKVTVSTPGTLSFATPTVATSTDAIDGPMSMTVANHGNADLIFNPPGLGENPLTGKDFLLGSQTTCPVLYGNSPSASLASGGSCAFSFVFAPASAGSFSESSVIDLATGPQPVGLNGTGLANGAGSGGTVPKGIVHANSSMSWVYTVTTLTDDATGTGSNCPNGASSGSSCTLRDAIAAVNASPASGDTATIQFAGSLTASATASSPALYSVSQYGPLVINPHSGVVVYLIGPTSGSGNSAFNALAIDGGHAQPVLEVEGSSGQFFLENLTLQNGYSSSASSFGNLEGKFTGSVVFYLQRMTIRGGSSANAGGGLLEVR